MATESSRKTRIGGIGVTWPALLWCRLTRRHRGHIEFFRSYVYWQCDNCGGRSAVSAVPSFDDLEAR